jgi:hypothetical protein
MISSVKPDVKSLQGTAMQHTDRLTRSKGGEFDP